MAILKVARMGHPVLRTKARALDRGEIASPAVQKLIDDMIDTMHEYRGVGLAGPQIHEGLRIFVGLLEEDPGPESDASVIINPEIIPNANGKEEGWEGCLSIPDIRGLVPRYTDITLRAFDRHGKNIELPLTDFAARIAQHETDHLDGVLFFDRMSSLKSLTYLDEYSRYHSKNDDDD
jgi:peptide deformylase